MKHLSSKVMPSNNRGRWLRTLGISAFAALGCFSTAASAIETDIGLEYQASGFYVQSDAFEAATTESSDSGFAHYLRIQADFLHEDSGVSVHTSINVLGDRWVGNDHKPHDKPGITESNGNALYVDYAYVQFPLGKTLVRVGRQTSNWMNCFTSCDDRRDRIMFIRRFGNITGILGYDKRGDTQNFTNEDDGDQFFVGSVIPLSKSWQLGLLYVYWLSNDDTLPAAGYSIQGASLFSPYVEGSLGMLDLGAGVNYMWGNNIDYGNGQVFADESWAAYLRVGVDLDMVELKAQYITAQDGGLISGGFDTYSSLINNNPDSTQNPTSVFSMGDSGLEGLNQSLYIANATVNMTPQFALGASVGFLDIEVPSGQSDGSMVYDIQASYQVNEVLRVWSTVGYLDSNDVGTLAGNTIIGSVPDGNGGAPGWDDGVMAASINMGVKF